MSISTMSAEQRNMSDYYLGDSIYDLADSLLPEMARTLGYELSVEPNEQNLEGLVGHIGPGKLLQDNIGLVQERMQTTNDALTVAADWVDRSGILRPANRSFVTPELQTPGEVDAAFITGGVARWMLRRAGRLLTHATQGNSVGRVYLPVGNREMKESEHALVGSFARREGHLPTERDFAASYITDLLRAVDMDVELFEPESETGDDLMATFARESAVLDGTVLAVGNAGSVIQTAGQFRAAARGEQPSYDATGEQMFYVSDGISVARHGESAATHQNPYTALGQIARNALFLERNKR